MKKQIKNILKSFSNIFAIVARDYKNIKGNYAAIIIVLGLSLIPSLYAWVNIIANWDPYSNTNNLPIAVVNNDMGAIIGDEYFKIGDNIAESCEENDSIGFEVVSEYEANFKLHQGDYYAIIEIPANFTSSLASYLTSTPHQAEIIYRANEKANAIATKITDVAQTSLTEAVKSELIKTVTSKVFEELNVAAVDIQDNESEILKFVSIVNESTDTISSIQKELKDESNKIVEIQSILNRSGEQNNDFSNNLNNLSSLNQDVRETSNNLNDINDEIYQELLVDKINLKNNKEKIDKQIDKISNEINEDNIENFTNDLNALINQKQDIYQQITTFIDDKMNELDDEQKPKLKSLKDVANQEINNSDTNLEILNGETIYEDLQKELAIIKKANDVSYTSINNKIDDYINFIYPNLKNLNNSVLNSTYRSDTYIDSAKIIVPQLNAFIDFSESMGNISISQLSTIDNKLENSKDLFNKVKKVSSSIDKETIDSIVNLMSKDPDMVSEFLSDPINLVTEDVYGDKPFGVSLTPFYTVLGIWVGILLMSALLNAQVYNFEDRHLSMMEKHFGKMFFFLSIALVQTTICLLGDIFILKVEPENIILFFLIGYLCCLVFTVIIFTLVSLFGNIGKAIAVIIMVFQIAGSGGIYPIQTNPEIFGFLAPLWPFTYAVDAFRQVISGPDLLEVNKEIKILIIMMLSFIVLSFTKPIVYKVTAFFDNKFKKSGL